MSRENGVFFEKNSSFLWILIGSDGLYPRLAAAHRPFELFAEAASVEYFGKCFH
jgi:hypothetical protein